MAFQIVCPRCQRQLNVAEHKAGSYGHCPRCRARLWIPAAGDSGESPRGLVPASRSVACSPLQGNGRPRTLARFVHSEMAPATPLTIQQGALPQLQLHETTAEHTMIPATGVHPLVMVGLLCLSVTASLTVLLLPDSGPPAAHSAKQQQARKILQEKYFSELDGEPRTLYQFHLRTALRAHQRGDVHRERECYREVLDLLRAERLPVTGVSGSPGRDRELERALKTLLTD